eukprot:COSAG05_NODE_17537_length_323_cov_1.178571_1_plen_56_part_10
MQETEDKLMDEHIPVAFVNVGTILTLFGILGPIPPNQVPRSEKSNSFPRAYGLVRL